MIERMSQLRPYSYGIVARNKAPSSFTIEVTPTEDLPMVDGEITDNVTTTSGAGTDSSGASYEAASTQSLTLTAEWLPLGLGNRQTPPDVRIGEQVMIYQFGDADKYYWVTTRTDLSLRRLETVIYAFSAYAKEGGYTPDNTTTYVFGVSSHAKKIWLSTSMANGEPYAYELSFDLENGFFRIVDNIDNQISLDSENHIVRLQNADGSFFELNKNVLNCFAADEMNWETDKWKLKAREISEEGQTRQYEGTQDTVKANQTIAGDWNTTAGVHGVGDAVSSGNFTTEGTMEGKAGMKTSRLEAEVVHADVYENLP